MTSRMPDWRIANEAAEWAARIDAGALDGSERARLAEWLRKSPIHVDELLFSASLMAGLGQVDAAGSLSVEDLLADVAPEVIPLFQAPEGAAAVEAADDGEADALPQRPALTRYWPALAASIALVVAVSWYGLRTISPADPATVVASAQTIAAPGAEPRSVALEDGSVVYLNAESRARVALTDSRRLVELLEGQAMFDVAPDRERPFRVFAGDAVVQAVGTKFTVEHTGGTVKVVVLEGQVLVGSRGGDAASSAMIAAKGAIADAPMASEALRLPAGREAVVNRDGRARMAATDPAAPVGWQARQLSFSDEGLSVIAAEFNRYNALKIVVADADLARTRFSGVFDAHDPESFIAFLEYSAEIRVERPRQGQVVLTAID